MKKLLCSTIAALSVAAAPGPASAGDELALSDLLDMNILTRVMLDFGVMLLRSQVDMTYDGISVTRSGHEISITGLTFYPSINWDREGLCEIAIARLDISSSGGIGRSEMHFEALGTTVEPLCLPPEAREPLAMTGYERIAVDRLYMDMEYEVGSSEMDLSGHLALADAAVVDASASFDYFWFREGPWGDPEPAMLLSSVVVSIEDRGLLERIRPIVPPDAFNFDAAPQIVAAGLEQALSEGGFREITGAERSFIAATSAAVGDFLGGSGRISAVARPSQPVWLGPNTFRRPSDMITVLSPEITSGAAVGAAEMIGTDLLAAALSGEALAPEDARRVGLALLDGVGAPLAPTVGRSLLEPLAGGDPEVAMAMAEALADDDPVAAYVHALAAAEAGADRALALLDEVEAELTAADLLRLQGQSRAAIVEAATGASELRDAALAKMLGVGQRRSYADAYVLASLAAAAGDLSSAALRDRIARRISAHDEDGSWDAQVGALDEEVLGVWTGLLGPRFGASAGGGSGGSSGGWGSTD